MSVVVNAIMSVMIPPHNLCNLSMRTVVKFGCFCFSGKLGFLDCDAICMCAVNTVSILSSSSIFLIPFNNNNFISSIQFIVVFTCIQW